MATPLTMVNSRERETDRDLVAQCLAGDAEQFRHLVRRYERVVIGYLRSRLHDRNALEDAAQETFVRAYRNLGKLRSADAFFSWLLGIADRVARESARRLARHDQALASYAAERQSEPELGPSDGIGDLELESALRALTEPLRQVVLLRFYADRSCGEIARQLQIPVSTVTKRLSRAYDHLRSRIEHRKDRT